MTQREQGFVRRSRGWIVALVVASASSACADMQSTAVLANSATEPVTTDVPVVLNYGLPTIFPASAASMSQNRGGLEVRVDSISVQDPQTSYTVKLAAATGSPTSAPAVPAHSSDIVWNTFDHMVNGGPSNSAPADAIAYGRLVQPVPYVVTLIPTMGPLTSPTFRISVVNHTSNTVSTVIHPQLYIDGTQYMDLAGESAELDEARHGGDTAKHLVHAIDLPPGSSETWDYVGPPHLYQYNSTGTILLKIPNVLVDPVHLSRATFQYVLNYRSQQRTRTVQRKSATMSISKLEADSLDGKSLEYEP